MIVKITRVVCQIERERLGPNANIVDTLLKVYALYNEEREQAVIVKKLYCFFGGINIYKEKETSRLSNYKLLMPCNANPK